MLPIWEQEFFEVTVFHCLRPNLLFQLAHIAIPAVPLLDEPAAAQGQAQGDDSKSCGFVVGADFITLVGGIGAAMGKVEDFCHGIVSRSFDGLVKNHFFDRINRIYRMFQA